MQIISLAQLRETDERSQRFTPLGLGLDRMLTPEAGAEGVRRLGDHLAGTAVLAAPEDSIPAPAPS